MLSPASAVVLCGFLMSLSAFSIDIILPLFKQISEDMGTSISVMPLTITAYMISLGVGQFVFGIVSDKYGRLSVLVFGLIIFIIGGIACLFATSIQVLLVARAVQGLGAASANILSRVIIRDLYQGVELARKMAIATGIFSVGPLVAPLLGSAILELGGSWRWVFMFMIVYGSALLWALKKMPETNAKLDGEALKLLRIVSNIKRILSHPQSRSFLIINAITMFGMIFIISTVAPIYGNQFGIYGTLFALYFAVHALGIIIGQALNHRLLGRIGIVPTTIAATSVMLTSCLLIAILSASDMLTPLGLSLLMVLFAVGFLSVLANSTSMALQPHGDIIGFTAALLGTVALVFSGVVSSALSPYVQHSVVIWSLTIASSPAIVLAMLLRWQKKSRTVGH